MSDRGYRRPRALSPLREHLRDTFWFAPTVGLVCAFAAWWGVSTLDTEIIARLQGEHAYGEVSDLIKFADDARTIVTTVVCERHAAAHAGGACGRSHHP
ncbi:hypothetical protein [Streptomyces sp. NBC_00841]|uniref:hypothetical protein n=1 Tax=Streptomyces sp. NBC_00841 TaxID=2975847 RepID=UPI003FA34650